MPKRLAFSYGLLLALSTSSFAQNANDFMQMFGGMMQQAMRQAAQSEWRRVSPSEISCLDQTLRQQGASVDSLIGRGVSPYDPRLAELRSNCHSQLAQSAQQAAAQPSPYVVDGLALSGKVRFESQAYRQYHCTPSEKFPGFTWCHKENTEGTEGHEVTSSNSILHNQSGTAVYINRYIEPAFFRGNDLRSEIERLSVRFGERAREFRMPKRAGFPNAIIAIWGKVELQEVSPAEVLTVASGGSHKGILLSYLGDLQRSAQAGVPVYELTGGAGFAWAATFNEDGRGVLRFLTIDASQMPSAPLPQPPPPDVWKDCQSKDTDTRLSGCTKIIDANGSGSPSRLADALDGRCWAYIDKKQYDHAVTDCKAAIQKNPRYWYAFSHLGEALIGLKDYADGIDALNKAIELKGNSIWTRLNRAAAFEATGQPELALKDYEFALFIDPSNQSAREGVVRLAAEAGSSPLGHGASPPCFEARNYWKNEVPKADATAATGSVDTLQGTISSLEADAATLTQLAQQKSNEARGYKQEQEQRLEQLPATRQQSLLNEVQKLAALYSDAQAHLDDLTKDVARQRTKVQEAAEGTNTRTTQQRLRPLREQLHSLETAKSEVDRDAQQKLSQLKAVTEKAERAAADFANTFAEVENGIIQADRTAQCATEARNQAQLLIENAKKLRVTLKQQRLAVQRETAETLISDVSEFSKRNPTLIPMDIASLVVALKAAVKSDDLEVISQARANLDIRLTEVKEFNGFRREVEAERQKQRRAEFETAVAQSHLMTDFVEEYVSRNLTSDVVPSLLKLNADIAAALTLALASSTAERLKPVLAAKEKEFAVLGVSQQYEAFLSKRQELEPPNKPQSVEPSIFAEAIDFLNDTHRFIADRKLIDGISEVALQALNLRTAIDKGDEASTRSSVNHLKELLGPAPGFTKFRQQQEQEREQERARRLAAVTFEAQKNIYFVDEYLRTHIGDKITEQLLKQKARLSAALTGQSSDVIGKANDMFQTYLKDNALLDKYQETAGKYGKPPPAAARPSPVETPNLANAREFLDDTQKFTADHKVDRISEIAQEALNLRLALDAFDEATAMQAKRHLSDLLDPVEGFREFRQVRDQDRDHERARRLAVTSSEAEKNLVFIDEYLRTHVGDKITEQLLKQRERLSVSLDSRLIDEITVANDTFRTYLNDNALRKEYEEVTKDYGKPPPSPAPKPGSPEEALGVSPKSRFAIAGPEHDIVLIYNASPSAPSVAKDILGNFVFSTSSANVCFAQSTPDEDHVWFIERLLRDQGAVDVKRKSQPCDMAKSSSSVDFIVFNRGELRKQPREYILGLVSLIENDTFREFRIVTANEYAAEIQNRRALSLKYREEVKSNRRAGYGVIIVTDAPLPVCIVTPSRTDHVEGLKKLISANRVAISMNPLQDWPLIEMNVDAAFIPLMKQQCGYVAGEASALMRIMAALDRERKPYEFAPVWFDAELVDKVSGEVMRKKAEKEDQDRGGKELEDARNKKQEAKKDEIEGELRKENGPRARALKDFIRDLAKGAAAAVDEDVTDKLKGRFIETQRLYPQYAAWLNKRSAAEWKTEDVTAVIQDFGTIQWNGRPLDGIIVKAEVMQKNRTLGKNEKACFVLGLVDDVEFSMERDPFESRCDGSERAIATWEKGREFKSKWNWEPEH